MFGGLVRPKLPRCARKADRFRPRSGSLRCSNSGKASFARGELPAQKKFEILNFFEQKTEFFTLLENGYRKINAVDFLLNERALEEI